MKLLQPLAATFLVLLIVVGCEPEKSRQHLLIGQWRLERLGHRDSRYLNVAQWRIAFSADGTWRYAGSLRGSLQGMQVSGSGTWSLTGNTLQLTTGNSVQAAIIDVSDDELTLTPDPVLADPMTQKPVASTYRRRPAPR